MKSDISAELPIHQPADAAALVALSSGQMHDHAIRRDRLVIICVFIVCTALTTVFYTHLGFSGKEALFAGIAILSACLGLVGLQAQARRQTEIVALKAMIVRLQSGTALAQPLASDLATTGPHNVAGGSGNALQAEPMMSPRPRDSGAVAAPMTASIGTNPRWQEFNGDADSGAANAKPSMKVPSAADRAPAALVSVHPTSGRQATTWPTTNKSAPAAAPGKPVDHAIDAALWPGTTLSAADPMRDQWAFRPRETLGTQAGSKDAAPPKTAPMMMQPVASQPAMPSLIDADLAHVQQKIKALAAEVNAAELIRQMPPVRESQPAGATALAGTPAPAKPSAVATAIDDSIDALKAVAASMLRDTPKFANEPPAMRAEKSGAVERSVPSTATKSTLSTTVSFGDLPIPASAQPIAVPAAAPLPGFAPVAVWAGVPPATPNQRALGHLDRAGEIAQAIEANQIDVMLSPIVDLGSNGVCHYDLTFLIKTASGQTIDSAEAELMLSGGDILALFDRARLVRASLLAARLAARQKNGSLLSPVTGRSMTNGGFLEDIARVYEEREAISNQLVLTFSQADIEQFTPAAWQSLSDMHAFGFRFALDQIDHVSADFKGLARRGFAFAKLDAKALLNGIPSRERFVPADEVCRILAGAGLALVASGLADENLRARIFGFGIIFGQGQLFGAPRPVDAPPAANPGRTAAA